MLLETKIRASDHSINFRVCDIDSETIESKKNVSSDSNSKQIWAELLKKVDVLKDTSKAASDFNRKMDKLTELTGHDYSHIKFKHNKYNEKNNS